MEFYRETKEQLQKIPAIKNEDLDVDGDEVDEIQASQINKAAEIIFARNKAQIERIEESLRLAEQGYLNECDECGSPIGFKRLKAIPGVRICISCAEAKEHNKKLFRC